MENALVVILGPTASGKTSIAVRLAREINGEIISADSRQVYRGMDLGTGKDLSEYNMGGQSIPCHLIDIMDPQEEFNLFEFQKRFFASFSAIKQRQRQPILAGGTGLYLESVILAYHMPEAGENKELRARLAPLNMDALIDYYLSLAGKKTHNTTDMTDRSRLTRAIEILVQKKEDTHPHVEAVDPIVIGIRWDRHDLRERITHRLERRINAGLIEEVQNLNARGVAWSRLEAFGLEYRCAASCLQGQMTREEMFRRLETQIHQFAKRQETWFRRMERKGVKIHWFPYHAYDAMKSIVQDHLRR
jgi:tRNA dimethylallyltransferase